MSTYNHVQHVVSVNEFRSIADLNGLIGSNDGDSVYVAGYYESINDVPWVKGGGHFVWDSTKLRTEHNGVTIFSPTVHWDGTQETLADYHAGTWEIEPDGVGCWVREYDTLNVHMAGAVGDGVVDDTYSFQSSITAGVTCVGITGHHNLSTADLSNVELIFFNGGRIVAASGQIITLGSIKSGLFQIFSGAGTILLSKNTGICYPEWFGAVGDQITDDYSPIQKCINAASGAKIEMRMNGKYAVIGGSLSFVHGGFYTATSQSVINGNGIAISGIQIEDGNWYGVHSFPIINGYTGFGVKVKGANIADIHINAISNCGDALIMETRNATHSNLLDSKITVLQIGGVTNGIVIDAEDGDIIQGNEIYCNFISNFSGSAVLWRSQSISSPDWDSNKIIIQATDPTTSNINAVVINNPLSFAINRWLVAVETWCGGMAASAKFISGKFDDFNIFINNAQVPVNGQIDLTGTGNSIHIDSRDGVTVASVEVNTVSNNLAGFNGGNPLYKDKCNIKYTVPVDWVSGETRSLYLFHACSDKNSNTFDVSIGNSQGAGRTVICQRVFDNGSTVPRELIMTVTNIGATTITMGTVVYFTLRNIS